MDLRNIVALNIQIENDFFSKELISNWGMNWCRIFSSYERYFILKMNLHSVRDLTAYLISRGHSVKNQLITHTIWWKLFSKYITFRPIIFKVGKLIRLIVMSPINLKATNNYDSNTIRYQEHTIYSFWIEFLTAIIIFFYFIRGSKAEIFED